MYRTPSAEIGKTRQNLVKSQNHLTPSNQTKYKVRISYAPLGKIEIEVEKPEESPPPAGTFAFKSQFNPEGVHNEDSVTKAI
jgi:hypothetical protein